MLNLSGEVLRLCLRVLLNGAGAGLGHSTKGSQGRVLCERERLSFAQCGVGDVSPPGLLNPGIQRPQCIQSLFFCEGWGQS